MQIVKLQRKRNNYIKDQLHKISKSIVELALSKGCSTIVIGDIKGTRNESYTSGVSAIDLEGINKSNYNKSRRIERLFRTNSGMLINADVNGALNILRKYIKGIPRAIEIARDNGRLDSPLRIRIA